MGTLQFRNHTRHSRVRISLANYSVTNAWDDDSTRETRAIILCEKSRNGKHLEISHWYRASSKAAERIGSEFLCPSKSIAKTPFSTRHNAHTPSDQNPLVANRSTHKTAVPTRFKRPVPRNVNCPLRSGSVVRKIPFASTNPLSLPNCMVPNTKSVAAIAVNALVGVRVKDAFPKDHVLVPSRGRLF